MATTELEIVFETAIYSTETTPGRHRYWQGRVLVDEVGEVYTQVLWWQNRSRKNESEPRLHTEQCRVGAPVVLATTVAQAFLADEIEKLVRTKYYTEVPNGEG